MTQKVRNVGGDKAKAAQDERIVDKGNTVRTRQDEDGNVEEIDPSEMGQAADADDATESQDTDLIADTEDGDDEDVDEGGDDLEDDEEPESGSNTPPPANPTA